MKFTIDTTNKVITILGDVNYLELTKFVNQMLPIDEIPNYTIKVKTEYIQVTQPLKWPLDKINEWPRITYFEPPFRVTSAYIQRAIDAISNT